jgi:membrane-associated phospholipid phosphatase
VSWASAAYRLFWSRYGLQVGVVLTLALFFLAWKFPTFPGDEYALLEFQEAQRGWLDTGAITVSNLGQFQVAIALILAVAALFWLWRRRLDALVVLLSLIPMGAGNALKLLVGRPRPDHLLLGTMPNTLSFPSGHAIYAVLLGGILICLANESINATRIRRGVQVLLLLWILAVGASRVYLGVHWPSDVLGGYLVGVMSLLGLIQLRNRVLRQGHQWSAQQGRDKFP